MRRITPLLSLGLALQLGGGIAFSQASPSSDPKQLLKDQFLYEFKGDSPVHWTLTGGKPYALQQGFHPNTGQAIRITTEGTEAVFSQEVQVADFPEELAKGNELQGQIHYRVEQIAQAGGALRLQMQWLDATGRIITTTEDKAFIDAEDLWIAYYAGKLERADIWRTLDFRTTVPDGAVAFRFAVRVHTGCQVALDDFSLVRAEKAEAFVSLVPQLIPPFHLGVGEKASRKFVFQGYHLGREFQAYVSGSSDFSTDVTDLDKDTRTKTITLTYAPKKPGRLPYASKDRINFTIAPKLAFGTTIQPIQVPLHAYAIDRANPPVIQIDKPSLTFTAGINGAEVTQALRISGEQLIDVVKIQLIQTPGTGFRLGANSIYFFPNPVPSAGLQAGINPTDIKVSFKPGNAIGEKTARLILTSTDARSVEVALKATVTSTEGGVWRELFGAEQKINDPRYREGLAEDVHYYKLGLWSFDGKGVIAEPDEKQLALLSKDSPVTFLGGFFPGQLYREDFPNGIESLKVRATYVGEDTKLAAEVSYDGGGSWTRLPDPTIEKKGLATSFSYPVGSHRPTTFRFLRTDDTQDVINVVSVEVTPAKRAEREQTEDLIALASFAGQTARPLLEESFDGRPHHSRLTLSNWQNIVLGGDRSFVFYDQHANNDIHALREESTAKISFYGSQPGGASLKKVALISPLLDYSTAKTKELTFRFFKDKPAEGDAFKISLAAVTAGKITQLYELPVAQLLPFGELKEGKWYDIFLDLKNTKEFEAIKEFALVFEYTDNGDPLLGNAASYLLDDITFGRESNTKLTVSPELISFFELKAERRTEARPFEVKTSQARGPVRCEVLGQGAQKFVLTTTEDPATQGAKPQQLLLPQGGGKAYVHAYSRVVKAKDNFAAVLYLQSRSAEGVSIKLFATPRTEAEVAAETSPGHTTPVDEASLALDGYVYASGDQLVIVAPGLSSCEVYNLAGALLGKYATTADRLEFPKPSISNVLLRLRYQDGRTQVLKY